MSSDPNRNATSCTATPRDSWGWIPLRVNELFLRKSKPLISRLGQGVAISPCSARKVSSFSLQNRAELIEFHPRGNSLFPMRPRVALLLALLPAESLDAKALRAVVANGFSRKPATHVANVVSMFWPGVRSLAGNYFHVCLRLVARGRGQGGPKPRSLWFDSSRMAWGYQDTSERLAGIQKAAKDRSPAPSPVPPVWTAPSSLPHDVFYDFDF